MDYALAILHVETERWTHSEINFWDGCLSNCCTHGLRVKKKHKWIVLDTDKHVELYKAYV